MNKEEAIKVLNARPYTGEVREALETLIPELKESEDERIRKTLINALKTTKSVGELKFVLPEPIREECITYLEKQKEQKPTQKFRVGDMIISTKNPHLTYKILEVGHINELGNPEYKVEIFEDGKPGIMDKPHNIHYMECHKVDEWGKLIEQKPAEWSEEDEVYLEDALWCVKQASKVARGENDMGACWSAERWLKSLPERFNLQPKQEWSEKYIADIFEKVGLAKIAREQGNDELTNALQDAMLELSKMRNTEWSEEDEKTIWGLTAYIPDEELGRLGITRLDILKKLKSLRPQPKQEWSEEDEKQIRQIERIVKYAGCSATLQEQIHNWLKSPRPQSKIHYWTEEEIEPIISDYLTGREHYGGMLARLRCLKPKSHWKPNEEQMLNLKKAYESYDFCDGERKALESLYEQLKQL